jgi:Cdc6-like AAA superfamily ATPase
LDAIREPGRHVILYGERGVGKTSLANIIHQLFSPEMDIPVVKVTANTSDTFSTIWHNLCRNLTTSIPVREAGFPTRVTEEPLSLDDLLPEEVHPANIVRVLAKTNNMCVFIIDEFDRVVDPDTKRLFADTIKSFSDNLSHPTIMLVGVARDVTALIGEHASIERNISQVEMPRMSRSELQEIIDKGLEIVELSMDTQVAGKIVLFSQGFPHYTHLLAKFACQVAIDDSRWQVNLSDFQDAVRRALDETGASIRNAYIRAVASFRESLFPQVILACALAPVDEGQSFRTVDVVEPLERITGKHSPTQKFTYHLGKLCDPERGQVLERLGVSRRRRYRFTNPMLRPYIILRAYSQGVISDELFDEFLF